MFQINDSNSKWLKHLLTGEKSVGSIDAIIIDELREE